MQACWFYLALEHDREVHIDSMGNAIGDGMLILRRSNTSGKSASHQMLSEAKSGHLSQHKQIVQLKSAVLRLTNWHPSIIPQSLHQKKGDLNSQIISSTQLVYLYQALTWGKKLLYIVVIVTSSSRSRQLYKSTVCRIVNKVCHIVNDCNWAQFYI